MKTQSGCVETSFLNSSTLLPRIDSAMSKVKFKVRIGRLDIFKGSIYVCNQTFTNKTEVQDFILTFKS